MKKDIKDYLHLYMGCECIANSGTSRNRFKLDPFSINYYKDVLGIVYPILRPLSSMDISEAKMMLLQVEFFTDHQVNVLEVSDNSFIGIVYEIQYNDVGRFWKKQQSLTRNLEPAHIKFMLSKGFDLFNLIPEGLAIDSTTLTQQSK